MADVFLALGSNRGDRCGMLEHAYQEIALLNETRIQTCSPLYETVPVGGPPQETFINQVILIETQLSPELLFDQLQSIEKKLGRKKTVQNGPRLIDIDIVFYDALEYKSERLRIPHPRLTERFFVLKPLVDIAPLYVHPTCGKTVQVLFDELAQNASIDEYIIKEFETRSH